MKMERELSKDEILELYLNKIFFGNRAYGVAAAAEFYYGKTLDQLTLAEMRDAGRRSRNSRPAATRSPIPSARTSAPQLRAAAHARTRLHHARRRQRRPRPSPCTRQPARAARSKLDAPYVAEMVRQAMERALRRRVRDQWLPRHHHRRAPTSRRRDQGGPRRPGRIRPPPWLARRRGASGPGRRRRRTRPARPPARASVSIDRHAGALVTCAAATAAARRR